MADPFKDGLDAYNSGDYVTALRLWRPLTEQGDARAQNKLGLMYFNGQGVPQDHAEAAKWYRLAAEQGLAEAQYNLGVMHRVGQGVSQDYVQAHMWINLAMFRLGPGLTRDQAVEGRDWVAERMTPAQIAEAQKLAREWKPRSKEVE